MESYLKMSFFEALTWETKGQFGPKRLINVSLRLGNEPFYHVKTE